MQGECCIYALDPCRTAYVLELHTGVEMSVKTNCFAIVDAAERDASLGLKFVRKIITNMRLYDDPLR